MTPLIRAMSVADLEVALDWAAAEGWNPGTDDAAPFHAADPAGFLMAWIGGEPIGGLAVVNHSDADAFLGLYLCRRDWRGRGVGRALWNAGLSHAGSRSVGLDGVPAQEANYARAGFVRTGATIRFEGRVPRGTGPGLRPARPDDLPALLALDHGATGLERTRFTTAWLAPRPDRRTKVLQDTTGRLVGFATARACRTGSKVGPVIAPDAETAVRLAGANPFPSPTAIDVPESNRALIERLAALGFVETFRTARMYRGPMPLSDHRQQAVATMELG